MRIWFVAFASIIEFPLMALHHIFPEATAFPLGGSDFVQHAILIGGAFWFEDARMFVTESAQVLVRMIRGDKKDKDGQV